MQIPMSSTGSNFPSPVSVHRALALVWWREKDGFPTNYKIKMKNVPTIEFKQKNLTCLSHKPTGLHGKFVGLQS